MDEYDSTSQFDTNNHDSESQVDDNFTPSLPGMSQSKVFSETDDVSIVLDNFRHEVAEYGKVQFWDQNHNDNPEPFEWYYGYVHFKNTIESYLARNLRVLIPGVGSSMMAQDMINMSGFQHVTINDLSRVAMEHMRTRCRAFRDIKLFQGNMCDTNLPTASFDAVIDKALFDSLLCGEMNAIPQYLYEVERLLTEDGVFIIISSLTPSEILPLIEQYDINSPTFTPWTVDVQAVAKPKQYEEEVLSDADPSSMYYIYICSKRSEMVHRKFATVAMLAKKKKNMID